MDTSWDEEKFIKELGSMRAIAPELLRLFLTGLEQKLLSLTEEITAGNTEQVGRLAHSIKGCAGQVCCRGLASIAAQVEHSCSLAQQEQLTLYLTQMMTQAQLDKKCIEAFLNSQSLSV